MNTTTNPTPAASRPRQILTTMRDDLRERRASRAAKRKLQAELAHYSTRAEVDDLMALLRHQEGAQAQEVRDILTSNRAPRSNWLAS